MFQVSRMGACLRVRFVCRSFCTAGMLASRPFVPQRDLDEVSKASFLTLALHLVASAGKYCNMLLTFEAIFAGFKQVPARPL